MMSFQVFSASLSLSPPCFIFLVQVISTWFALSIPDNYQACSKKFSCGNITARYPFWGGNRQVLCGHPQLRLHCEQDVTTMVISDVKYQVLDIIEEVRALKIARQDYVSGEICPLKLLNTTFNSALFDLSTGYEMITLLYGLLTPIQFFTCPLNKVNYINGFIQAETGLMGPRFNVSVKVPVVKTLLSEAKGDLSVLKQALQQGFELTWKLSGLELCGKCIESHGSCGFEIISMQTICNCPNGQVNLTTPCSSTFISSPAPNPMQHPASPGMYAHQSQNQLLSYESLKEQPRLFYTGNGALVWLFFNFEKSVVSQCSITLITSDDLFFILWQPIRLLAL